MGSITPLENKPKNKCRTWRLFISCGTNKRTKKRIQKSRRFHGTYGEAKKALAEFEAEYKKLVSEDAKFGDFLDAWYEKRVGKMRESTLIKDRQSMRTLKWLFGEDTHLSDFDAEMVDTAFQDLLDNGGPSGHAVKPSYAGYLKATLNSLMRYAIKEGYLLANPLDGTEHIPVRAPEKDDVPSAADVKALLDALDCRDGRQMCVYLCATLGLRRSEALGLRWGDVDFEKKAVNIRVSLQADRTLGKLKTAESRRTLPMPDYLADALGIRQAAAKADLKVSKANSLINEIPDWDSVTVCCGAKGESTSASMASHWWEKHRALYDIKCGLHGLRHALLTTLAEQNVHPRTMMAIAGHTNPALTLRIYAHSNLDEKEKAFGAIYDAVAPDGEEGGDDAES